MFKFWIASCMAIVVLPVVIAYSDEATVKYPDSYRSWSHAKSMVIKPGHSLADPFEGIHHVYANPEAIDGLTEGRYEDGAVFVFDLLNFDESADAIVETDRKFIGVMEYNLQRFEATGGWGFEVFVGDSRTERAVTDGGQSCFGCHTAVTASSYVFTTFRD